MFNTGGVCNSQRIPEFDVQEYIRIISYDVRTFPGGVCLNITYENKNQNGSTELPTPRHER